MKLEPDAREAERDNPDDKSLAYALLDGTEGVLCEPCNRVCHWCSEPRPCICDEGGEISQRESKQMVARAGFGAARRSQR